MSRYEGDPPLRELPAVVTCTEQAAAEAAVPANKALGRNSRPYPLSLLTSRCPI
jgi:hypothetical protein